MSSTARGGRTVLVITAENDATAGLVTAAVQRRGGRVVRFDTRDFPKRVRLDAELGPRGWHGTLATPGGVVDLVEVTAVYVRRPTAFDLPDHLSASELRHAGLEARYGLGGLLASLPVRWCNHPAASADASYKPRQLAEFRAAGLAVPGTLLANDAEAVRRFAAEHDRIVCKPIATGVLQTGDGPRAIYTRLLEPSDLADLSGVDFTAHLFQEFVAPKAFEVRLTVIGQTFLAARIDAHSERAKIDWRTDLSHLDYQVIDTPPQVRAGVLAYMKARGLVFGCFDFVVTQQESWLALECNTEGQWQWIAQETGLPIAESIATWLLGTTPPMVDGHSRTIPIEAADIAGRLADLADKLAAGGALRTAAWRAALTSTWRHVFVPRYFALDNPGGWPARWRAVAGDNPDDHAEWLDAVYSDQTLVTDLKEQPVVAELGGGTHQIATSSSTVPSLMLRMLHDLDIHPGHQVLEIGTGTGYTAALLSHRLGAEYVTSIDIDPQLVERARQRLAAAALYPHLGAADGDGGWPDRAPYDRILATCSVERVPPAWVEQTRPGGKIVVNLRGPIMFGALALLDVLGDGTASGRFLPGYASFMALRHDPAAPYDHTGPIPAAADQPVTDGATALDPTSLRDNDAWGFFAQLHLRGVQVRKTTAADGDTGTRLTAPDGSWAVAWNTPEDGRYPSSQAGRTPLWDTLEHAHAQWTELGRPCWHDFGITVTPTRQHIHLAEGDHTWEI